MNMKLMIVEDEVLCLENIVNFPWDTIGVDLIGSSRSAVEAIEKIRENPPDIIISDIEMEDGNGFYLAEQISYIIPNCKIIFLTAYDKFEYVQKAISYKVYAFILKPISRKKIMQTVCEAKSELEKIYADRDKHQQLISDFTNCKYFLSGYFFSGLTLNPDHLSTLFPLGDENSRFQVVIVANHDKDGLMQQIDFKIFSDIITILEQSSCNIIPFYDQNMLTYIFRWDPPYDDAHIFDLTFEAALTIENYMDYQSRELNYTIAIGSVANSVSTLPYCNQRAKEALKYRFSLGENEIIYIDDVEPLERSVLNIDEMKSNIIDSIKIGNLPLARKNIHTFFENMKKSYTSIDIAQRICFELLILISIAMSQLGQKPEVLFDKTEIWTVLKTYNSLPNLEELMLQTTEIAISLITTSRERKDIDIVNTVKDILSSDTESNMSLQEMAKRVYISPCYLSSLFKSKTGTSYKNYTIQLKIDKAKELLAETDLPIYEIATSVGYKSNQHFSHLFQAQTGLLPTEYRSRRKRTKNNS